MERPKLPTHLRRHERSGAFSRQSQEQALDPQTFLGGYHTEAEAEVRGGSYRVLETGPSFSGAVASLAGSSELVAGACRPSGSDLGTSSTALGAGRSAGSWRAVLSVAVASLALISLDSELNTAVEACAKSQWVSPEDTQGRWRMVRCILEPSQRLLKPAVGCWGPQSPRDRFGEALGPPSWLSLHCSQRLTSSSRAGNC